MDSIHPPSIVHVHFNSLDGGFVSSSGGGGGESDGDRCISPIAFSPISSPPSSPQHHRSDISSEEEEDIPSAFVSPQPPILPRLDHYNDIIRNNHRHFSSSSTNSIPSLDRNGRTARTKMSTTAKKKVAVPLLDESPTKPTTVATVRSLGVGVVALQRPASAPATSTITAQQHQQPSDDSPILSQHLIRQTPSFDEPELATINAAVASSSTTSSCRHALRRNEQQEQHQQQHQPPRTKSPSWKVDISPTPQVERRYGSPTIDFKNRTRTRLHHHSPPSTNLPLDEQLPDDEAKAVATRPTTGKDDMTMKMDLPEDELQQEQIKSLTIKQQQQQRCPQKPTQQCNPSVNSPSPESSGKSSQADLSGFNSNCVTNDDEEIFDLQMAPTDEGIGAKTSVGGIIRQHQTKQDDLNSINKVPAIENVSSIDSPDHHHHHHEKSAAKEQSSVTPRIAHRASAAAPPPPPATAAASPRMNRISANLIHPYDRNDVQDPAEEEMLYQQQQQQQHIANTTLEYTSPPSISSKKSSTGTASSPGQRQQQQRHSSPVDLDQTISATSSVVYNPEQVERKEKIQPEDVQVAGASLANLYVENALSSSCCTDRNVIHTKETSTCVHPHGKEASYNIMQDNDIPMIRPLKMSDDISVNARMSTNVSPKCHSDPMLMKGTQAFRPAAVVSPHSQQRIQHRPEDPPAASSSDSSADGGGWERDEPASFSPLAAKARTFSDSEMMKGQRPRRQLEPPAQNIQVDDETDRWWVEHALEAKDRGRNHAQIREKCSATKILGVAHEESEMINSVSSQPQKALVSDPSKHQSQRKSQSLQHISIPPYDSNGNPVTRMESSMERHSPVVVHAKDKDYHVACLTAENSPQTSSPPVVRRLSVNTSQELPFEANFDSIGLWKPDQSAVETESSQSNEEDGRRQKIDGPNSSTEKARNVVEDDTNDISNTESTGSLIESIDAMIHDIGSKHSQSRHMRSESACSSIGGSSNCSQNGDATKYCLHPRLRQPRLKLPPYQKLMCASPSKPESCTSTATSGELTSPPSETTHEEYPTLVKTLDNDIGIAKGDIVLSLLSQSVASSKRGAQAVTEAVWRCRTMRRNCDTKWMYDKVHHKAGSPSQGRTSICIDVDEGRVSGGIQSIMSTQHAALEHLKYDDFEDALELYKDILEGYTHFFENLLRKTKELSRQNSIMKAFKLFVGVALHNVGTIHLLRGDFEEAHTYFERATMNRESSLGEGHSDHISSLIKLAICSYALEDFPSAHQDLEEAFRLATTNKSSLADHRQIAEILNNLACLSYMRGQSGQAHELLEESMGEQEFVADKSLYAGSRFSGHTATLNTSVTRANIGLIGLVTRDLSISVSAFECALRDQQLLLRDAHATLIATMDHLVVATLLTGRKDRALQLLNRMLHMQLDAFGPNDPRCCVTKSKVETLQMEAEQEDVTAKMLDKTLQATAAGGGSNSGLVNSKGKPGKRFLSFKGKKQ